MFTEDFIKRIEAEAAARGLKPAQICKRAVDNHGLYASLKSGGSCTLAVAERVIAWLDQNPPPAKEKGAA